MRESRTLPRFPQGSSRSRKRLARKQAEDQTAETNLDFHAAFDRGYARYISQFAVVFDPLQGFLDACCMRRSRSDTVHFGEHWGVRLFGGRTVRPAPAGFA